MIEKVKTKSYTNDKEEFPKIWSIEEAKYCTSLNNQVEKKMISIHK